MHDRITVLHTSRLDLVAMTPELMRAMLAADWATAERLLGARLPAEWRSESWAWIGDLPERAERDPALLPWLPRVQLRRAPHAAGGAGPTVVGEVGFHGPPDDDATLEIGYMVVTEHRRQGYAEEAVRAMLSWAVVDRGVTRFRACVGPKNTPSLNLVHKLGFALVGNDTHPERGEQLIFLRDGVPD